MKKTKIPEMLEGEYKSLEPILRKCLAELKRIIIAQLRKIQNPELVRIRLTEARVKSLASIWRKAQKKEWKVQEILKETRDLVGFRIVCANIEDVYRIKELLLSNPRIKEIAAPEEDRIAMPTSSGYRDFKFYVQYETGDSKYSTIICEIQIRTALQDSWAILTHKDIYKEGDDLPESLKKLSYRLSQLLDVADQIAQDIREQVSEKREPSRLTGKLVNADTLRVLFKKAFRELPPDYLVRLVKDKCDELSITHIKPLEEALLSEKNKKQLQKAYARGTGWNIPNELIFEASPLIAACGIKIAMDAVYKLGTQEWSEIDQIYRREIMSELPDTFEEFLDYLEPHTKDELEEFPDRIYQLAEVFDALKECSLCGAPIIDEEIFAENAQEHYGVEDLEGKIESAILNSGADVGEGSLCSYHAYHKDD
jgi:putative GTP pyrophosphokinase